MNTPRAPNTSARLMIASIPYSPCRVIAMPMAIGISPNDRIETVCSATDSCIQLRLTGSERRRQGRAHGGQERDCDKRPGTGEPLQLQPLHAVRPPEAPHQRPCRADDGQWQQWQHHDRDDLEDGPQRLDPQRVLPSWHRHVGDRSRRQREGEASRAPPPLRRPRRRSANAARAGGRRGREGSGRRPSGRSAGSSCRLIPPVPRVRRAAIPDARAGPTARTRPARR